ncbi:MAG: foldase protein PrsA [Thermosediminibacterales bacterium]|nr:foldase protein PrsA [Thermosediminibacterales bacterium]
MNQKKVFYVLLVILTVLSLTGCNLIKKEEKIGKTIDGQEVVAVVNDEKILKSEYDKNLQDIEEMLKKHYGEDVLESEEGKTTMENIKKQLLEDMINNVIIEQEAKKRGIEITEDELEKRLDELKTQFGGEQNFEEFLKEQGLSLDDVKKNVTQEMLYSRLLDEVTRDVEVTEKEVKEYYDLHINEFKESPDEVRARHILVSSEEKAREILKQIKDGADFAELAKKNSEDPESAEKGGDLGYFRRGQMVAPFEKAAFELEPGQVSDIVKTDFGYHIIKVEDKKIYPVYEFQEVENEIRKMLLSDRKNEVFTERLNEWKDKSRIKKYL